jgi:acyl-CoA synthetase
VATEVAFNAAGWFMTGDLGHLDAAGYLRITGRKKDVIIRGGHNIHPAPIEALALRHRSVEQAAAFPIPDPRLGERVCLAIVPTRGATLDPDGILEHLAAGGMSISDLPEFILCLTEMPLTPSGKIVKRELMRWVAEGKVRPHAVRSRQPEPAGEG